MSDMYLALQLGSWLQRRGYMVRIDLGPDNTLQVVYMTKDRSYPPISITPDGKGLKWPAGSDLGLVFGFLEGK